MPGYAEIFGGAPAHHCLGNDDCEAASRSTLADQVRDWTGSLDDAAVFASWPDLVRVSSQRPEGLAVSAGRSLVHNDARMRMDPAMSELLDRGARADAWPGEKDFRPDRYTAPLAERYLEVVRPRFLFLSLGESDEYGHQGNRDGYVRALRYDDEVIADLYRATHGESARGRRTTIFVTADHGRAFDFRDHGGRWPESARSWLVVIGDEAPNMTRVTGDYTLSDLAPTVKAWLGMPEDDAAAGPRAGSAIAKLL
jgi:arylsulfatase A-like enzyme